MEVGGVGEAFNYDMGQYRAPFLVPIPYKLTFEDHEKPYQNLNLHLQSPYVATQGSTRSLLGQVDAQVQTDPLIDEDGYCLDCEQEVPWWRVKQNKEMHCNTHSSYPCNVSNVTVPIFEVTRVDRATR